MDFKFTRQNLKGREAFLERLFEILPGFASWTILLGMSFISFWQPLLAAILIIAFDFYWLLRLFYMTLFLILAYFRLSVERKTDWMARVHELDRLRDLIDQVPFPKVPGSKDQNMAKEPGTFGNGTSVGTKRKKVSLWFHRRKLEVLKRSRSLPPPSNDIYQLVIFSVAKETQEIIEPGIRSLTQQKFPPKQILVVIALEERSKDPVKEGAYQIQTKYRSSFLDFLVVLHPDGLPGEARVKGANVTYAAKEAARYLEVKQIPFEQVIVSCFDADTVVSHDYFGCLTYHFMTYPKRTRASFQPIPVYHNNVWEAPAFGRVLDVGASFFQLIEATDSDKLVTFSSHSMSFKALVEVGYWPVDIISDDSAIFWRALIHFDGNYRVIPMYTTLSMDVVSGANWWETVRNVYQQKRRWAWGVENFPIVMRAFFKAGKISFYAKIKYAFKLFEDNVAWATWAFLLAFIGWLPVLFAGREFSDSVLYYSAPRITRIIFNLASLSLIATIVLSLLLLPRQKAKGSFWKRILFALEWLFVPVIVVFFSALPALDAQTRLMFGKYMEFWVTEKKRK
ncbi:MAG: glycosyltransferase family 2 protein [Candidatus Omnitrophica bacterium]|nr:glycosyltransferase family 2 protein [Candidatus Omnitrophota bacterium]